MESFSQTGATPLTTRSSKLRRTVGVATFVVMQFLLCPEMSIAFQQLSVSRSSTSSRLFAVESTEDEITRQLERAKALLAKSKAKMEAKDGLLLDAMVEDDSEDESKSKGNVPFFASQIAATTKGSKRDKVVKATNKDGLVTIDGDLMAQLSEAEEWEVRSLVEVFENEGKATTSRDSSLADRDVAASIFGLQRVLQTEDFHKIFDKRNRFIGEQ